MLSHEPAPETAEVTHTPTRPGWDCARCAQPWPCPPARVELGEQFTGDVIGLGQYMATCWVEALNDLPVLQGTGELHERMLGWIRRPGSDRQEVATGRAVRRILNAIESVYAEHHPHQGRCVTCQVDVGDDGVCVPARVARTVATAGRVAGCVAAGVAGHRVCPAAR